MDPFFSIIIPVYNAEKYLNESINSVLGQTFKNFEIILVNDGSQDRSADICNTYAKEFSSKVTVVHKENEGQISARYQGIKIARGKYICYLDSDDYLRSDALERVYKIVISKSPEIVIFQWKRVNMSGEPVDEKGNNLFKEGEISKKDLFEKMLETSQLNTMCLKICKYDLFDINIDYKKFYDIRHGEDLLQSLELVAKAEKIYYLAEQLYFYRFNPNSITNKNNKMKHKALEKVFPVLYRYIGIIGVNTEENFQLFFRGVLVSLWESLLALYTGKDNAIEWKEGVCQIYSYDMVKKGGNYIKKIRIPKYMEVGLNLFYSKSWKLLTAYLAMIKILKNVVLLKKCRKNRRMGCYDLYQSVFKK